MAHQVEQPQLVLAVLSNSVEQVIERLDSGDDIDAIDYTTPWHMTALMCASIRTMVPIVELLISRGANLNITSSGQYEGMNSLHFACRNHDKKMIRLLVDAGATLNSVDRNGQNILHELAINNDLEGLKIVSTKDIEDLKYARDSSGRLPVDCVSKSFWKRNEIISLLTPKQDIAV
jgi:ankyrin repeat protein